MLDAKDPKRMLDPEAGTDPALREGLDAIFHDLPSEQELARVQAQVTASVKRHRTPSPDGSARSLCEWDASAEPSRSGITKVPGPPGAAAGSTRVRLLAACGLALFTTGLSLLAAWWLGYL